MVMKYHVSVDCQESYIFPRGYIITRENITILPPPTCDTSSVPVNIWYIRWSKWMISSKFDGVLWLSQSSVTRLGVCVHNNLNANLTAWRTFYYDVLLLTAAYSDYAGHFFLGQFPNMELLLLLLSLYSLLNSLYFPGWWNITLFLTGCLCALKHVQARPSNISNHYSIFFELHSNMTLSFRYIKFFKKKNTESWWVSEKYIDLCFFSSHFNWFI